MNSMKPLLVAALFFILLGVVLGAFGAHALKAVLTPAQSISFETAVRYQNSMSIGVLALLAWAAATSNVRLVLPAKIVLMGIPLFSGSIYLLTALDPASSFRTFIVILTPIGGLFFVVGWLLAIWRVVRN
jgi:uncharacterized membrane protein YgdD (TMEM256/DUF423 family)